MCRGMRRTEEETLRHLIKKYINITIIKNSVIVLRITKMLGDRKVIVAFTICCETSQKEY